MIQRFVKRSNIDRGLADIYFFILQDKIEPADRFLEVAEEAFQRHVKAPYVGRAFESKSRKLASVREYPMPAPYRAYLIFYRILPTEIDIITVTQGTRDLEQFLEGMI